MALSFKKIEPDEIKEGMRFSAPVFFEDGKNMFLAEGKCVREYHLNSLKRWKVPYLLTYGRVLSSDGNQINLSSKASVSKAAEKNPVSAKSDGSEGLEEIEELEEL